ncbi:Trm112 family protein [Wenzhouxiangella marina]|uniref:Uncharacterized protein n=1 Tax=Wenzhouxiangella marina TaxID=1579979 RepID=A0A0K0XVJ3_9GAMM|nr:Trm112 family protein [Wenzhouxiangella marina]AKS41652.1 hypothetical protein WM2015_1278 [Wenzhouxiangella marina]MBB6086588.1 uncharacterized protein YbaR (Trm112 family) [Wenzhouxiangella marina]
MTLPDHLLDILCCPVSHEPLLPLSRDRLKKLNRAIEQGGVETVDHQPVKEPLNAALITRNHKVIYPIVDGIPVLLAERGIGTTQFDEAL